MKNLLKRLSNINSKRLSNLMKKLLIFLFVVAISIFLVNLKLHIFSSNILRIKNTNKRELIYLYKRKEQEKVYGFRVHIYGNINGKAKIVIYQNSPKGSFYKKATLFKNVNINWRGERYADKIVIDYKPISKVKSGKLEITYEFKGI